MNASTMTWVMLRFWALCCLAAVIVSAVPNRAKVFGAEPSRVQADEARRRHIQDRVRMFASAKDSLRRGYFQRARDLAVAIRDAEVRYFGVDATETKTAVAFAESMEHLSRVGAAHADTLVRSMDTLDRGFKSLRRGDFAVAETLMEQATSSLEAILGRDDFNTANAYLFLAQAKEALGKYEESERIYIYEIRWRKATFGTDHPLYLDVLAGLGGVYAWSDNSDRCVPLYKEAMVGYERLYGPDSGQIYGCVNGLGLHYLNKRQYEEAEHYFRKTLAYCEGYGVADTKRLHWGSLQNLGSVYIGQKRFREAETFILKSLQICEANLPDNHPHTANVLDSYAAVLRGLGRNAEAQDAERRVASMRSAIAERQRTTASSLR